MNISLLAIEIHKNSQSWIVIGQFNRFNLFLVEWDFAREIDSLVIIGIKIK